MKKILFIIAICCIINIFLPLPAFAACTANGGSCTTDTQCCSGYCGPGPVCMNNPGNPGNPGSTAVDVNQLLNSLGGLGFKFTGANGTLGNILTEFLPIMYGIAGVGLLLLLIWGGFNYLTSAGDPKKMEAAKGVITAAVIGFVVIIAAFWLTQMVNYILGLGVNL